MSYYDHLKESLKNVRARAGLLAAPERREATGDEGPAPAEAAGIAEQIKQLTALVAEQGDVIVKTAKAYEELKDTNDRRLKELEKRKSADVLDEEKIKRINEELDELGEVKKQILAAQEDIEELETRLNRPEAGENGGASRQELAHRAAFEAYARKSDEKPYRELEQRDASPMMIGSPSDGGYAVPEQLDRQILKLMADDSPLRRLANVITVGTSDFKKLVNKGGTSSGWVGETDPRAETDPSKLAEIAPTIGEIYAYPGATQHALDDIYFDVESFIRDDVYDHFADEEARAFVGGNGSKKPMGFLQAPMSAKGDKTRPFGKVQKMDIGAPGSIDADALTKMPYALKAKHRKRAVWLMNSATIGEIRTIKNANGDYLWVPGLAPGQPDALAGHRVEADENMPDLAAGSMAVALGNWKRAYMILDRKGIRFLRDPLNKLGYVYFYFTKRVGGHFVDTEAYKVGVAS